MTADRQSNSGQNKLWIIPLGCGCGCLTLVVAVVLFGIGGIASLFTGMVKSTGSYQTYQMASERIKTDPAVIAALGEPISPGWISRTTSQEDAAGGTTCLRFSVTGSRSSGTAYVETERQAGAWNYYQFNVSVNGQSEPIVLIAPPVNRPASLCPDFDADPDFDGEPTPPQPPTSAPSTDSVNNSAPIAPLT